MCVGRAPGGCEVRWRGRVFGATAACDWVRAGPGGAAGQWLLASVAGGWESRARGTAVRSMGKSLTR